MPDEKLKPRERLEIVEGSLSELEKRLSKLEGTTNEFNNFINNLENFLVNITDYIENSLSKYVPLENFNQWITYFKQEIEGIKRNTQQGVPVNYQSGAAQPQTAGQKIDYKPGSGLTEEKKLVDPFTARNALQGELKQLFARKKQEQTQ